MFFTFICALLTRFLFILISLIGVWRVVSVKNDELYWLLTVLYLPLVVELVLTLRRRGGKDYKWFSPAIFLFLISIIPSIWILELDHEENKSTNLNCQRLNSPESLQNFVRRLNNSRNGSEPSLAYYTDAISSVCAKDWMLALHQILLILLILGKWLMPVAGDLTRDQLSQLLLIFVGTAADILEFTSETMSDISDRSPVMVYIILAVWTWSMLQFPLHFSVISVTPQDSSDTSPSRLLHLKTDIWSIMEALFIHDGPFLVVRLVVMMKFHVIHQMLIFFVIKNILVVALNIYRLYVLACDKSI